VTGKRAASGGFTITADRITLLPRAQAAGESSVPKASAP